MRNLMQKWGSWLGWLHWGRGGCRRATNLPISVSHQVGFQVGFQQRGAPDRAWERERPTRRSTPDASDWSTRPSFSCGGGWMASRANDTEREIANTETQTRTTLGLTGDEGTNTYPITTTSSRLICLTIISFISPVVGITRPFFSLFVVVYKTATATEIAMKRNHETCLSELLINQN